MAKFPTEVVLSEVMAASLTRCYAFLWDVLASSRCIPGIDRVERVGNDVYRFTFKERSTGPVSMTVRYTARYVGNGKDEIRYTGTGDSEDNTDVDGVIRLTMEGPSATRVELRQTIAPDTPVPRLLQGLIKSFVQREASDAAATYLANVKSALASGRS